MNPLARYYVWSVTMESDQLVIFLDGQLNSDGESSCSLHWYNIAESDQDDLTPTLNNFKVVVLPFLVRRDIVTKPLT